MGVNFNDARKRYIEIHGQLEDELRTFQNEPQSKDKYIDYHKISNIELINREYQGLLLIKPIELTTAIDNGVLRKYIMASINDCEIVQLKISKHGLWNAINGRDTLVVRKRIDHAYNGNDLAQLTILHQSSTYERMEAIDLTGILKHKYGTKLSVDLDVIYTNGDYMCAYADDAVYKISMDSLDSKMVKAIDQGNKLYRMKQDQGNNGCLISTRRIQTRPLC